MQGTSNNTNDSTTALRSGDWIISLPAYWSVEPAERDGQLYFEALDGAKGLYLSTWDASGDQAETPLALTHSFGRSSLAMLHGMEGYDWDVHENSEENGDGTAVLMIDGLAAARCYRIVTKIMASRERVVRASFHDYDCTDLDTSRAYFLPFIDSLRFYIP